MRRIALRIERAGSLSVMSDMFMGCFVERELLFWPICEDTKNKTKNPLLHPLKYRFKAVGALRN
jgi:hypothetical protein